jgi:hypothetical protein
MGDDKDSRPRINQGVELHKNKLVLRISLFYFAWVALRKDVADD